MVPPSDSSGESRIMEDPYVADLLKVADENIARLREEVHFLTEDKVGLEGKISNLQRQVIIHYVCWKLYMIISIRPVTCDTMTCFLVRYL